MRRKSSVPLALVSAFFLVSADTSQVVAANMRSFIEAVRRKATVVYVGSVKDVQLLTRTKFDIRARALMDVLAVMRNPGANPREATIESSQAPFPLDFSFRAAAMSYCTASKHSAMPSARCLPTNSGCMKSRRKIVVFSSPCTTSFLHISVHPNDSCPFVVTN